MTISSEKRSPESDRIDTRVSGRGGGPGERLLRRAVADGHVLVAVTGAFPDGHAADPDHTEHVRRLVQDAACRAARRQVVLVSSCEPETKV